MNTHRKIHLIGNAHLDPVWLWRWQEGLAEVKATFRSALDRMQEFPEFIFTCAGAAYYRWVEENAPDMFAEIQARVREGRWVIAGGWWVQPDCNIPSGESFVRHGLYSQRYFQDRFGVMAKVGYNVDSFGHSGMLPQILSKSGMPYYVYMRPGEEEKDLPYNLFWWESRDGSKVMTFKIPFSYSHGYDGFEHDMDDLADEMMKFHATLFLERKFAGLRKLAEKRGIDLMGFYGVGNHGGGPTIKNLELIRRLMDEWGGDCLVHSSPNQYFEEINAQELDIPTVREDLQHHARGCYAAHSEIKESNRRAEHAALSAEKAAALAGILLDYPYPGDRLRRAWQLIMFNQFHDILGGCSIKEAYTDARESMGEALHISAEIRNASLQRISWAIDTMGADAVAVDKERDWQIWDLAGRGAPLVVFNPLSWLVDVPIQVNKDVAGVFDENGNPLAVQRVRGSRTNFNDKWDTLFIGNVPAMGYRVFFIHADTAPDISIDHDVSAGTPLLENEYMALTFERETGYIKSLYDKKNSIEVFSHCGAVPIVIDESGCDTWAHGVSSFRNEVGRFTGAEYRLLEKGPLRTRLRVTSRYHLSTLQQDFILYGDRPEIEVRVKLDWRERHRMLKLSFPVYVAYPIATYEIPYGFIERPVNGEEEPGQQWIDLSGTLGGGALPSFGLAVINDAKYSYDVKDNDIRMTVVRSPIYADHFGERDEYCEYMDQGVQEFKYILLPHTGDWTQSGVVKKAYELNVPPVQIIETHHKGALPLAHTGIDIAADTIIATVFKKAEDGYGYILRCYETCGIKTETNIRLTVLGREWDAAFGPCEIKTFFIPGDSEKPITEKNLIEM